MQDEIVDNDFAEAFGWTTEEELNGILNKAEAQGKITYRNYHLNEVYFENGTDLAFIESVQFPIYGEIPKIIVTKNFRDAIITIDKEHEDIS